MPRYLTISRDLQIVRGEGCGFLPGPPVNDLESAEVQVSAWLQDNEAHPDADEAKRWLDVATQRVELRQRERQVVLEVAAFRNALVEGLRAQGDTWASWRIDTYHQEEIRKYEKTFVKKWGWTKAVRRERLL